MSESFKHLRILTAVRSRGKGRLRINTCEWSTIKGCHDSYGNQSCNFSLGINVHGRSDRRLAVGDRRFRRWKSLYGFGRHITTTTLDQDTSPSTDTQEGYSSIFAQSNEH